MDDLSFRRRIFADPNDTEQDIVDACLQDPNKAKLKSELQQLDDKLSQALDIDIPDNLSERILLSQTINEQKRQRNKSRFHYAMAASVLFSMVLFWQVFNNSQKYTSLAEHALAHVYAEPQLLERKGFVTEDLNEKLADFGAFISNSIAPVKFSSFCTFDGVKSLHLVFQGDNAPVTVFLIPNTSELDGNKPFTDKNYSGNIMRFKQASMVIVTDKNESSTVWQQKLTNSLQWQKA